MLTVICLLVAVVVAAEVDLHLGERRLAALRLATLRARRTS